MGENNYSGKGTTRRDLFRLSGGGALAALLATTVGGGPAPAQTVATNARILIVGAGAAGLSAANRLARRLDGAQITLLDPRQRHLYQPGFTLIAAGLRKADYSVSTTAEWVPRGAMLIAAAAAEFDPEANTVTTASGQVLAYDFLIVSAGIKLDYNAIEGMDVGLIGRNGIGSVYASPEAAAATWAEMDRFTDRGGVALFSRPATEMKCAGAPLKYTFLTDDFARRKGTRGNTEIVYAAHSKALFGVPIVNEKVRMLYHERGIDVVHDHVMTAIDPGRKIATFRTPDGPKELGYDFTNVIPPMRAVDAVRNSPLPWQTGPWAADGWVEADRFTMRHPRFPNVFSLGDVAGVPKGKTAASVKWQVPVAVDHIVADIAGETSESVFNGYTSCPLITRVGRAMLIEFDYNDNLVPSFPGVIPPLEELWISWLMKETALKATYLAMVRGRA